MQQLQPLNSLKPLNSLETRLKPMFEKDTRKYYSNLELISKGTELLYEAYLLTEDSENLSLQEKCNLNRKVKSKLLKANVFLNIIDKNPIFWNDEDIEHDFVNMMLSDVEEC